METLIRVKEKVPQKITVPNSVGDEGENVR